MSASVTVLVAALGMLLSLLAVEVQQIKTWTEVFSPVFVGTTMGHIGAVIAAYVAGRLNPPKV